MKNVEKIKPTGLFTNYIFKAIPLAFDESLSYYECLCGLLSYLKETVIPTVNNNADAIIEVQNLMTQLQNYVDNYFNNLDVQEEINNKLDEMVEAGTLQEIIADYLNSKAVFGFDNVESMKKATNLIDGSYARTLGFYSKNDGGSALYKIRKITNNDVIDEMFIIKMETDENLVAELIIDGKIHINKLGADSTGKTDSSLIIQKALDFINNRWINEKYDINTIVFDGIYKVDKTIEMSPFARLTGDGYTTFITSCNPVIWIHYPNGIIPASFPGTKQNYQYANLIDFPKGCLFKNNDGTKQNTCIEIGEHSDLTTTHNVARFKLCNFSVMNYEIGILYNDFNVYLCNHERLMLETNSIAVKYGHNNITKVNSGEHMLFDNCLFAGSDYAFKYETSGFDTEIVNSSIDFNTYVVSDPYCKGYHKIAISTSHIEGNNYILGTIGGNSLINIINNRIISPMVSNNNYDIMTTKDHEVTLPQDISDNICNLLDNYFIYSKVGNFYNPEYITNKSYMNITDNNNYYQGSIIKPDVLNGNIIKSSLDSLSDGDIDVTNGTTLSNHQLKIIGNTHLKTTAQIVTDNYLYTGHKSLVLSKADSTTDQANFNIETTLLPVKKRTYVANCYTYNRRNGDAIKFYFYDKDGNEISQTDGYHYNPNPTSTSNEWYMSTSCKIAIAPLNAAYFKVAYYFSNWNMGEAQYEDTKYRIGGLIIN